MLRPEDRLPELLTRPAVKAAARARRNPRAKELSVTTRRFHLNPANGIDEASLAAPGHELVAHAPGQRNRHQPGLHGLVEAATACDVNGDPCQSRRVLVREEGAPEERRHAVSGEDMLGQ
jgi:hypothetical protein